MFSRGFDLIIISMIVFGVLNLIENLIHYNIGRSSNDNVGFIFFMPTFNDFIKIICVMIVFGFAQGIITELFMKD